jgi:hypothetical protein
MYVTHVRPAIHYCFKSFALIQVWESTGRFITATSCAFTDVTALRCRQEYVLAIGLAGDMEGSQVREPG